MIVGPAPDDWVQPFDHRPSVGPAQGSQLGAEALRIRLWPPARLDQQLAGLMADVESKEIEAFLEGDDARLSSLNARPLGASQLASRALTSRPLPGVAQSDEIIRLCRVAVMPSSPGIPVFAGFEWLIPRHNSGV